MKLAYFLLSSLLVGSACFANSSITLMSETGDTLMIHQLKNGELWGSFIVTDQIAESFAEHEQIIMQLDQQQPINLQGKRACGGAAGKPKTVDYQFVSSDQDWLFNNSVKSNSDIFQTLGLVDQAAYRTLTVDRRYEWVDFPIQSAVGLPELLQQFQSSQKIVFRYTTQAFEQRLAEFKIDQGQNEQLDSLLNRKKAQ
jgi:hypothetical protein